MVIIGGGLGGLAAALRLAVAGWQVTVCEQSERMGGKMNVFDRDGYRFDTGPSLITMPHIFAELFESVGSSLEKHLELVKVTPLADYVFADGTRFTYSTYLPDWLETVKNLEPRDVDGFLNFMRLGAKLYTVSKETFLKQRPLDFPDWRTLKVLPHFPLRNAWGNYQQMICKYFRSPHLRQLYGRYPTYVGSSPYSSPATLAVIPFIEYAFGGWHIRGGLYQLVQSLMALASELNIDLLTHAEVGKINHDGRRVSGVRLGDGREFKADVVIMNGDAACTPALLNGGEKKQLPNPAARSLSGFVLLRGLRRKLPDTAHHTIYFSGDYQKEFRQLFDEKRFPDDPTVYVCAPSRTDSSVAPAGGETLFIMANAPANGHVWWDKQTKEAQERVFERLSKSGFPDIETDTVVSDQWSPDRFARDYLMPGGAIYGTNSHGWRRAFLRPSNKDSRLGGLYYVGGSSHPGGGTPTVLQSARITCDLIRRYED